MISEDVIKAWDHWHNDNFAILQSMLHKMSPDDRTEYEKIKNEYIAKRSNEPV